MGNQEWNKQWKDYVKRLKLLQWIECNKDAQRMGLTVINLWGWLKEGIY